VIVTGKLRQRSYEAKDGSGKRTVYELGADEVGVSLRNATAKVTKASRAAMGNGEQHQTEADPWGAGPADRYSDEPPFWPHQQARRPLWLRLERASCCTARLQMRVTVAARSIPARATVSV
jgi:single-stranded DNA-binding protein